MKPPTPEVKRVSAPLDSQVWMRIDEQRRLTNPPMSRDQYIAYLLVLHKQIMDAQADAAKKLNTKEKNNGKS